MAQSDAKQLSVSLPFSNLYPVMADILHPDKTGNAELRIRDYSIRTPSFRETRSGIISGQRYAVLYVDGEIMMSDTPMERRTNSRFVQVAHGNVLIGGLGLGLLPLAIQDNPAVTGIYILEKSKDVIDMITTQISFGPKVHIIEEDVYAFTPRKYAKKWPMRYDCIYMDIWSYTNSDVYYEQMLPLKQKYRRYLKAKELSPTRFVKCWAEREARENQRLI